MGCDIHALVEKKTKDGKWVTVNTLAYFGARKNGYIFPAATERNYRRFAALAGVRGDGPDPRGIPPDASETAAFLIDYWGADGHSHSYMPLREASEIFAQTERPGDDVADDDSRKLSSDFFFGVDSEAVDSHRLVFWFDN